MDTIKNNRVTSSCVASLTLVTVLSGCAGGGGASPGSPPGASSIAGIVPGGTSVSGAVATLASANPTAAETSARASQGWLNQINLPYANQLKEGNGTGVTIGVVDSGAQVTHAEIVGKVSATYNASTGTSDVTDAMGHGTHVSGILVGSLEHGSPVQGVASGATLAVAKVFNTGAAPSNVIEQGIDWAVKVQRTPILSLSLGATSKTLTASVSDAVAAGTLVVAATGNNGYVGAANWPAEFAKESWANGQIIAVGAVDATNKRAAFSNYDPTLANWTVYAPGVSVLSSYSTVANPDSYAYMSGTSMAAPMVAGQAALIKSNWQFLSASSIAQIIFKTATHLCADGITDTACTSRGTPDPMYGWGLINIGESLQPVGALAVSPASGVVLPAEKMKLASPKSGLASGLSGTNVVATDQFNRGFLVNLGSAVSSTAVTAAAIPSSTLEVSGAGPLKLVSEYASGFSGTRGALKGSELSFANETGSSMSVGLGSSGERFFGLEGAGLAPLNLSGGEGRFSSPYFGLMGGANFAGYGYSFSQTNVIRAGLSTQEATEATGRKSMLTVELQKKIGALTAVLSAGQLSEAESMLGLAGTGALALGGDFATQFLGVSGAWDAGNGYRITGMTSFGQTGARTNSGASLISGTTESLSMAWSLGLTKSGVWTAKDALTVTASMPLRTMTGELGISAAMSQNKEDGSLNYGTQWVGLAPSGREHDLELAYRVPVTRTSTIEALAQVKFQPGHNANAPTQGGIGIKYRASF
jgi:hypothetical protein